ncbi:phosphoribosylglycinamide formyltransferase [Luminiphilus sp.]|jgi:phosphoribosylglycinamide formyltransferase-1|nr:phosphoribosylglycinamide formyltransferase [Luminiphilus sp.]MDA9191342.1 phosphoribosylglycinamide formyltransferase [bacterium]MDA9987732.1 phosphoribosylglycinamide formyltransferase [Luminiphilus sp.]
MTRRIVVLLSGRGSNFQSLLNASLTGELSGSIDLVISNRPQAGGLAIANNANIDTALIDHQAYATRDAFDADLAGVIDSVSPDLIVLAGFMRILTQGFVSQFAGRLLNIHPSLLPLYPGLNTHQRALDNGDTHAGATVHYVTGELDGGPSVIQAKVPIESGDTKDRLAARILRVEHQIYPQAVNWHLSGRLALQNGVLYKDSVPLPATGELWRAPQ